MFTRLTFWFISFVLVIHLFIFITFHRSHPSFSFSLLGAQIPKKLKRIFSLGLPSIIFAVTCTMPANLTIYWFINNNITVLFFFLCKQPTIKKYLGIPDPPDMSQVDMSRMASFQDGRSFECKSLLQITKVVSN